MFDRKKLADAERNLLTYHTTLSMLFLKWLPTILAQNNDNYLKLARGISVEIIVHENEKAPHSANHQLLYSGIMKECLNEFGLLVEVCNAVISTHYELAENKSDFDSSKDIPDNAKDELNEMFNVIYEAFFKDSIELSEKFGCYACCKGFKRIYNGIQ